MTRPDGFYWVCCNRTEAWVVGEWVTNCWYLTGMSDPWYDEDLFRIGEQIKRT